MFLVSGVSFAAAAVVSWLSTAQRQQSWFFVSPLSLSFSFSTVICSSEVTLAAAVCVVDVVVAIAAVVVTVPVVTDETDATKSRTISETK